MFVKGSRNTVLTHTFEGADFYALQRGKHILYSRRYVHPVPCLANNFKTTGGIEIKLGI